MFRFPSLNALRAFEVAARHQSMKEAAAELNVTPGAVSRHVQYLESVLKVPLFERHNREVVLTPAGRTYMKQLNAAFGAIHEATEQVQRTEERRPLHIWSSITFTMRWLMPRLPSFQAAYPSLDVVFTTSLKPMNFAADRIDLAIRNHPMEGDGLTSHLIFETPLVPACSPGLVASGPPLATVADLAHHTLLRSSVRSDDWTKWLAAAGAAGLTPAHTIQFETSSLAYQAAVQGLGVVIAQRALIEDDLATGRLVVPLDFQLDGEACFFLTYRTDARRSHALDLFCDWIMSQAPFSRR